MPGSALCRSFLPSGGSEHAHARHMLSRPRDALDAELQTAEQSITWRHSPAEQTPAPLPCPRSDNKYLTARRASHRACRQAALYFSGSSPHHPHSPEHLLRTMPSQVPGPEQLPCTPDLQCQHAFPPHHTDYFDLATAAAATDTTVLTGAAATAARLPPAAAPPPQTAASRGAPTPPPPPRRHDVVAVVNHCRQQLPVTPPHDKGHGTSEAGPGNACLQNTITRAT